MLLRDQVLEVGNVDGRCMLQGRSAAPTSGARRSRPTTPTGRMKIRSSRRSPIKFWKVFQLRRATHRLPSATHHLTKGNVLQPEGRITGSAALH